MRRHACASFAWLMGLAWLCLASASRAQTLEAPVGGAAIALGNGLVACAASGGWTLEAAFIFGPSISIGNIGANL
jgi:hypothetical protein